MSWQTVLDDKSRSKKSFVDASGDHNVDQDGNDSIHDADTDDDTTTSMLLSEETALHTIRLSYQLAMELLSKSILSHDDYWCLALEKLEYTSSLALSYINQLLNASSSCCYELQELSYLSRRNLLDCLIKDINNDKMNDIDSHGHDDDDGDNNDNYCRHNDRVVRLSSCYKQCINLVNTMIDMNKYDNILLLKTSELALDMNDIWTYKQLILFTNYNRSHLYSDKVLLRYQDVIHNQHKLKRMLSSDDDRHHQYHHLNNYNYEYNCNNSDHKDNIYNNDITTDNINDTNEHHIDLSNLITRIEAMKLVTSQENNKFLFSFIHQLISHDDISYAWLLSEDLYDNHHHHSEKYILNNNNNYSLQTGGCDDKDIINNANTDSNDDICIGVGRINNKALSSSSSSSSSSIAPSINKRSLRKRDRDDDTDKDDIAATTFTTTTTSTSSAAAASVSSSSSSSAAISTSSKKVVSYSNYSDADDDDDGMNELRVSSNRR